MITFPNDSPWEYSFTSSGNQKKKKFFFWSFKTWSVSIFKNFSILSPEEYLRCFASLRFVIKDYWWLGHKQFHPVLSDRKLLHFSVLMPFRVCFIHTFIHPKLQFSSVAQSCLILCDHMDCSMPGLPIHHQLPELAKTHVHLILCHPLLNPKPMNTYIHEERNESVATFKNS